MGNAISSAAAPALYAAISALELVNLLDPRSGAGATAAAQAAVRAFLPFAAAGGLLALFTSVALIYRDLRRAGVAAAAGAGNRFLSEHVAFMLCAAAGFLQFFLFVVQAPDGVDVDQGAARELGPAALRSMPAVATASFFLGMLLIIVGHMRAGGEGGGGAVAVAGPIEAPMGFLAKMAVAAAATLDCLMAVAVCFI